MSDFRSYLDENLQDPAFAREWEDQEPERQIMAQIVTARKQEGLSQKELADRCGMKASNLSRIENGNGNPSLATLLKIAHGLGKQLKISFV